MSEIVNSFKLEKLSTHPESFKTFDSLKSFFSDNLLTPLIVVDNINKATDSCEIKYYECDDENDKGSFINFGGLMINTKSLCAVLGYNANPNSYIPLFDIKEFFNVSLFSKGVNLIGKEETLYIIERFKLDFRGFSIHDYIMELISNTNTNSLDFSSVLLNFVQDKVIKGTASISNIYDTFMLMTDKDILQLWSIFFRNVLGIVHALGKELFGNFIVEDDIQERKANANKDFISLFKSGTKGYENAYLQNIKYRNIPPVFAREAGSMGFGMNRRKDVISSRSSDYAKNMAILSSGSYIDTFNRDAIPSITDEKIYTYNMMDILRGVNKDQDIFFSYDTLIELNNDQLFKILVKKLNIDVEISNIGISSFIKHLGEYNASMKNLQDTGGIYSTQVKKGQRNFTSFSTRELIGSGKLIDKIFQRVLKKF